MSITRIGTRLRNHGSVLILILSQLMIIMFLSAVSFEAQAQEQSPKERKLIARVEPEYPDTLKRLYIGGVVRVEVEVEANGTVKGTKLLGGSPILGQSTMKAIRQWKYAPAAADEIVTVKYEFDPHR